MNSLITHGVLVSGLLIGSAGPLLAAGFRMPHQDPEAIARGNAFVATADNPSAVYYNPAGITQLDGHHWSLGAYLVSPGIDFTAPDGRTASPDSDVQFVPQAYYVLSPQESPWSFGFGLYAPFGLGADWGKNTPFTTEAEEATLVYVSFNPVVAYQVNDCLSVAAGLAVDYSDVNLRQATVPGGFGQFKYEGDDVGLGFTLGLLYQPTEQWSFGVLYRSRNEMNYDGTSKVEIPGLISPAVELPTTASLDYPQYIDVGVSYRPNDDWNFEFNLDWTDWDSVDTATFKGTALGDVPLPFNYESGFMYEFGVTRQLQNGYWVSAGYVYSENSVPDETLTPLNPDGNLHIGSVGFGRRGDAWSWALGYHFAYNDGRSVTGNTPSAGGETSNGVYETFNNAVNFSIRRSF
jgi:long-chain fatty acid transport protein